MRKLFLFNVYRFGLLGLLSLPVSVQAAAYKGLGGASKTLEAGVEGGTVTPLPTMIGGFIGALLGILGIILVVYVIQAGIMYMTAGGDATKVTKAKEMITRAIIGIIIIVAAYSISQFVINLISNASGPAVSPSTKPAIIET